MKRVKKFYSNSYLKNHSHPHEKWVTIPETKRYAVSNYGRVYHKPTYSKHFRTSGYFCRIHKGYKNSRQVNLSTHSKSYSKTVKVLVAKFFVPNPAHFDFVYHKDGNPDNDRASNLRWLPDVRKVQRIKNEQKIAKPIKNEEWRPIKGFHNKYFISNLKRIKDNKGHQVRVYHEHRYQKIILIWNNHKYYRDLNKLMNQSFPKGHHYAKEVWKLVPHYPDYMFSNLGRLCRYSKFFYKSILHVNVFSKPVFKVAYGTLKDEFYHKYSLQNKHKHSHTVSIARLFLHTFPAKDNFLHKVSFVNEKWKTVPFTNDTYKVSNYGRVYQGTHITRYRQYNQVRGQRMCKKYLMGNRFYVSIIFTNQHHKHNIAIDRLVARMFVKNPNHYHYIKHIDGNILNNHASDLKWIRKKQNFNNRKKRHEELEYRKKHRPSMPHYNALLNGYNNQL